MIQNLIKIEECDCSELFNAGIFSEQKCFLTANVNFEEINTVGNIQVSDESSYESNELIWTTTITYKVKTKAPQAWRRKAFRMTAIDGTKFLVGTGERPFPVIKESNPYPDKPTGTTLMTVTVTWKSRHGLMEIIG